MDIIRRVAFLLAAVFVHVYGNQSKVLRMVTWNVADNSRMDDGFTDQAIDQLLGIGAEKAGQRVEDIFAVGLQEQCWQCNYDDMMDIGQTFLRRLNLKYPGVFEIIGIEGTRESNWCELGCKAGTHGTTALLVIAKKGVVTSHRSFHRNDGCSDRIVENDEKGVAYMQVTLNTGQSVCLATSHLESRSPKHRRQCLDYFFSDAEKNVNWSDGCDFHFLSGDFNTRTAAAASPNQDSYLQPQSNLEGLRARDEMLGSTPFGQDADWRGNLLDFINSVQNKVFKESPLKFRPTYKLAKDASSCSGKVPCYRTDRPLSWTDRILHTNGKSLNYDSIPLLNSDHLPVFEEFQLS